MPDPTPDPIPDVSENLAALLHEMIGTLREQQRTARRDEGALVVLAGAFVRFARQADEATREDMVQYLRRPTDRLLTPGASQDAVEGAVTMAHQLLDNIQERVVEMPEGEPVQRRDRDDRDEFGTSLAGW